MFHDTRLQETTSAPPPPFLSKEIQPLLLPQWLSSIIFSILMQNVT